ncbi:ATPase [Cellulomonas flavigena DSM 20109]|uniref:ATPase n=1 Tax=Cellulomonas flavigena (strain ATCC 482 / DSM 20109 / BCRC 11376 / JCM 18109 / NBRC 3775 / NCIMB 8073 / NRS 134) TaxID=446466 RepID=D5UCQ0_CELFN|nr:ATPase [Cellulomonas flavigena DSM 20109]
MLRRPPDLFDREHEWSELAEFASSVAPGLRIALVSGRRRVGKSYLLRRLAEASTGPTLVHQARELSSGQALDEFASDVADALGLPGGVRFATWEEALRAALGVPRRGSPAAGLRLLVIDELPYLVAAAPEIPSILQLLHDEARTRPDGASTALILSGSSLSVMSQLHTGSAPLRGRALLDLSLPAFDYRTSALYWDVSDADTAFQLDAILGGTPGYRALVPGPPASPDLTTWLGRTVLNPASVLYGEKSVLLREDPRMVDIALYNSILAAIAEGRRTPREIGSVLGRDFNGLRHPLAVLEAAGFVLRSDDVLTRKRPVYALADPIVAFTEAVIEPHRALIEERDVATAWQLAQPSYLSRVVGPRFEHTARVWTAKYAGDRFGTAVGHVGSAVVNEAERRTQHEIDVVALPRGVPPFTPGAPVLVLGEAKATARPRGVTDLRRLERLRDLVAARGYDVSGTSLLLVSRSGFDPELLAAARDERIHLVDLPTLYGADHGT